MPSKIFKVIKSIIVKHAAQAAGTEVSLDPESPSTQALLRTGHIQDPKAKAKTDKEEPPAK